MEDPNVTFFEAVKASWKKEIEIGNPGRILRLTFWTVWLTIYRFFRVVLRDAFYNWINPQKKEKQILSIGFLSFTITHKPRKSTKQESTKE